MGSVVVCNCVCVCVRMGVDELGRLVHSYYINPIEILPLRYRIEQIYGVCLC